MKRDCADNWIMIARRIGTLYVKAKELTLMSAIIGDTKLFSSTTKLAEQLLDLQHDLEAWEPGECFDTIEFTTKLARIEQQLNRVKEKLTSTTSQLTQT